ncbi:MAG: hypothetical protein AAFU67_06905, partial [Bacteroidota bacterium]
MYYQANFFRLLILSILLLLGCQQAGSEGEPIKTTLDFTSPGPRAQQLIANDGFENYFSQLSLADMRLQLDLSDTAWIDTSIYKDLLRQMPMAWPYELVEKLQPLWFQVLRESEAIFPGILPDTIHLILTDDQPYGSHVYFTRNMAVIMPQTALQHSTKRELLHTFRHELFHLISRNHLDWRPILYAMANFQPISDEQLIWPDQLTEKCLSNPDAANHGYALIHDGKKYLPILFRPDILVGNSGDGSFFSENIRYAFYKLSEDLEITEEQLLDWKVKEAAKANSHYF